MRALLNTRQVTRSFQLEGRTFLGRAAQTEARRRLVIAALALERYRLAHSSYPNELQSVEPEELTLKGPLFAFFSTNVLQFFPFGNVYSDKGAFFRARLAHQVGSYSLTLTSPSGEHLRTITGSATNGIVELNWDLICENGTRYTNESFNSSWTVTLPDPKPEGIPPGVNLGPEQGPAVQR
jgi:hypothetical protein